MKKYILIFALCAFVGCKDNSGLYGLLTDYDSRISALERLCSEMNTNISSITTIVEAQQTGDYITSITPIMEGGVEIGYTITFDKHDPITIYHGHDGQNGQDGTNGVDGTNGTNGTDGHTPIIGVAQDTDGVYYWTLDGEWLLDGNGNKLRVTGENGQNGADGQDGQDGTNGANGTNGADGITPQLKIEADYWWISYDNGATWTQLGKAKGDKGEDGTDDTNGTDGQDGDSMFQSVTYDENNVYFTLVNGTVLTISKNGGTVQIVDGAIMAPFSVSATKKVYFSKGDLQYNPAQNKWRFAEHQWEFIGEDNVHASATYDGWIDIFGWGTGNQPLKSDNNYESYGNGSNDITKTIYDWGTNPISNGGNQANIFYTLTRAEWIYLYSTRTNASKLRGWCLVNGQTFTFILPDNWSCPSHIYMNAGNELANASDNKYTLQQIDELTTYGVVVMPYNQNRGGSGISGRYYWLSSCPTESSYTTRHGDCAYLAANGSYYDRYFRNSKCPVRVVKDAE